MPSRQISSAYLKAAQELRGNEEQWAAYESKGNCVMLAGPGSGKTKALVLKLARILVEDVQPPRGVVCITFSQEAARELKRRLAAIGLHESSRLFIGTVHSFCLLHLLIPYARLAELQIPDPIQVAPLTLADQLFRRESERMFGLRNSWRKHDVDLWRRAHLDRNSAQWRNGGDITLLAEAYEGALRASGFMDFEDLVLFGQRLVLENDWVLPLVQARFPVLAVDEYQDLGVGLHRIVQRLTYGGGARLIAVGDVDQSVYGFNGANSELLSELGRRADVEQVTLRLNYRCANRIIRLAEQALGEDRGYRAADEHREAHIDSIQCADGLAGQARTVMNTIVPQVLAAEPGRQLGDIAVLYRTANVGDVVAQAATAAGYNYIRIDNSAPYKKTPVTSWIEDCAVWCSGGWAITKPMLRDLIGRWIAFHRTRLNQLEDRLQRINLTSFLWQHRDVHRAEDFVQALRTELLDELLASQPELSDQAAAVNSMSSALADGGALQGIDTLRLGGRDGAPDQLNLLTLHSAKGTEYDVVIMVGLDQGSFPWRNETAEVLAESRRLFYVGITRAKYEVFLLYSGFTEWNGRRFYNGPSIFLDGLIDE